MASRDMGAHLKRRVNYSKVVVGLALMPVVSHANPQSGLRAFWAGARARPTFGTRTMIEGGSGNG